MKGLRFIGKSLVFTTALAWILFVGYVVINLVSGTSEGEDIAALVGFYGGMFLLAASVPALGFGALFWALGARPAADAPAPPPTPPPATAGRTGPSGPRPRPTLSRLLQLVAFVMFGLAALPFLRLVQVILAAPDVPPLDAGMVGFLVVPLIAVFAISALFAALGIRARRKAKSLAA